MLFCPVLWIITIHFQVHIRHRMHFQNMFGCVFNLVKCFDVFVLVWISLILNLILFIIFVVHVCHGFKEGLYHCSIWLISCTSTWMIQWRFTWHCFLCPTSCHCQYLSLQICNEEYRYVSLCSWWRNNRKLCLLNNSKELVFDSCQLGKLACKFRQMM